MGRPEHFPHAPVDWSLEAALGKAREEGIELEEDHWAVILALQEFFAHHDDSKQVNRRLLHDALNEKFHHKGGSWLFVPLASRGPHRPRVSSVWFGGASRQCGPILRKHLITACIFNPGMRGCCTVSRRRTVLNQLSGLSDR